MSTQPPKHKFVKGFTVHGLSVRTKNQDEFQPQSAKLPTLWQNVSGSELISGANIYSVYSNFESDVNGHYTVTIGNNSASAEQYDSVQVESGDYLVFTGQGAMPETVVKTWQRVWAFFTGNPNYQRKYLTDFETYAKKDEVTIYIGVEPDSGLK